ncbi:hypothetical protein QVD17_38364 [Tagetes erecta]|uniref:VQ domain-containing protein n=1 Tax=Tagetes erecta TaxID=13708 RepID=A0AAD8NG54_TARER|nr:hypothetical protein QVD17_38364 [Tagetes erecta]
MDSGNSSGGDGGGAAGDVNPATYFNPIPILQQQQSNFFNSSSFSQPQNPNPNPNPNFDSIWSRNQNSAPIYNPDHQQDRFVDPISTKTPKKRTRASRRAPTTVLTTDTSNFRQMVQEFTGIPNSPFATSSSSSPFTRRSDFFAAGVAPVNPVRPSAMKITGTSNFQLPPSETHGFTKQPLDLTNFTNLTNLQNQVFPFQSFSQSTLPNQVNDVTERENRSRGFGSSSMSMKRWRGEDESFVNLDSGNVNSQNAVVSVSLRNDGGQLPGNEDSWICPSD